MVGIVYKFASDIVAIPNSKHASAQKIGETLAQIHAKNNGRLVPKDVVEHARSPTSPLHRHFTWDDAKAAEAHRIDQARQLIQIVVEVKKVDGVEKAERQHIASPAKNGGGYITPRQVRESPGLAIGVLTAAQKELESFMRRYQQLEDICAGAKSLADTIAERRRSLEIAQHPAH